MFLGEYDHTIDAKGRLAVPARFRMLLESGAVIGKGMGGCISIYTLERWNQKSEEQAAGKTEEQLRRLDRRIFPSANIVDMDGQGRMVIPVKLRAYAKLESEVTIVGVRDHIEIWDSASWQAYQQQQDEQGDDVPF